MITPLADIKTINGGKIITERKHQGKRGML